MAKIVFIETIPVFHAHKEFIFWRFSNSIFKRKRYIEDKPVYHCIGVTFRITWLGPRNKYFIIYINVYFRRLLLYVIPADWLSVLKTNRHLNILQLISYYWNKSKSSRVFFPHCPLYDLIFHQNIGQLHVSFSNFRLDYKIRVRK